MLVVTWALLAAPCLCAAGLVHHECCEDESPHCDHGGECPSDPCDVAPVITVGASPSVSRLSIRAISHPVFIANVVQEVALRASGGNVLFDGDGTGACCFVVPLPDSDVPLLI